MEDLDPVTDGDQGADPYTKTDLEILDKDEPDPKPAPKPAPKADPGDIPPEPKDPDDDDEEDPKKLKEKEDDEEDDDEEDEEDEDEDDVDIPDKSPEYRDLKKAYPDIFKKFPGLRHDFFRVKAFDKLFTSVDEATEVAQRYDGLVEMEKVVSSGNAKNFINGLGQYSKPALQKMANDFLPSLAEVDKDLHDKVAGNLLARVLKAAQAQGRSSGNKNLFHAASHLSMFLWDKEQIPEAAPTTSPEIEEQRQALEQREKDFFDQRHTEFIGDVKSSGERQLRKEVSRGLDPDDVLPEFVKEAILDSAMDAIDEAMGKDEQHVRNMNTLWERAARQGHGKDFKNRLIQQYVSRARTLVGPIRRRLVGEAIAKINKKPGDASSSTPKKAVPGGKAPGADSRRPSPKDIDWSKTSDLDYLNRNFKK
jgi:hypothetical protein